MLVGYGNICLLSTICDSDFVHKKFNNNYNNNNNNNNNDDDDDNDGEYITNM